MTATEPVVQQAVEIDVARLKVGNTLLLETEKAVYEMVVLRPELGLLEIESTDPILRLRTVGQLLGSPSPDAFHSNQIVKGLAMSLRFRNGNYLSAPVLSARVRGPAWHYDVF